jgi:predicted amidophosphoribosyltransferase
LGEHQYETILTDLCELVAKHTKADMVLVVEQAEKKSARILGAFGGRPSTLEGSVGLPKSSLGYSPIRFEENLESGSWFKTHPLSRVAPFARSLIAVEIEVREEAGYIFMAVFFNKKGEKLSQVDLTFLLKSASLISSLLKGSEVKQAKQSLTGQKEVLVSSFAESISPVGDLAVLSFLDRTLTKATVLHSKSGQAYISVRKWKAQLKDAQIAALEGLKLEPNFALATLMAKELAETVSTTYAGMKFDAVVPIPCGSSGLQRCLAVLLAEELAKRLKIPCYNVLKGEVKLGRSHPKKSYKLAPFTLKGSLHGHVLLVDDVISTGAHLLNAKQVLIQAGLSVSALGWVG